MSDGYSLPKAVEHPKEQNTPILVTCSDAPTVTSNLGKDFA